MHIHDKPHLTDDTRMVQLRMHVTGDAARTISGLGLQGIMHATALKTLKERFGQPSVIARAFISKTTERRKIQSNDRQALRQFSLDMSNCLAMLRQINYFADVNANDNLQKIVRCFPNHLIEKWKTVATEIREKGEVPQIQHISNFINKKVKAEFDPDFGNVFKNHSPRNSGFKERKGIHLNQTNIRRPPRCFICQQGHRVPHHGDCKVDERMKLAMDNRLCFSCLVRGHPTREC